MERSTTVGSQRSLPRAKGIEGFDSEVLSREMQYQGSMLLVNNTLNPGVVQTCSLPC